MNWNSSTPSTPPSTTPPSPPIIPSDTTNNTILKNKSLIEHKDDARSSRLKVSNTLSEKIFSEWQKLAMQKCDADIRAYWVCRQENGLMVVFNCRKENDKMQTCVMDATKNETEYAAYKHKRMTEIFEEQQKLRQQQH